MKAVIFLGDGMSDRPVAALDGKTPLMVACKPAIDRIARQGQTGLFQVVLPGQSTDSAVANLAVLGYDPAEVYQGRAVLEAASMGVELDPRSVALRCNLIAVADEKVKNHSAGHISSEEAAELLAVLEAELGGARGAQPVRFHPGVSYRHLLVLEGDWASPQLECAPPHDHVDEPLQALLPRAEVPEAQATAARLVELIRASQPLLKDHPVNTRRRAAGKDTADTIWPWSPGRRPAMRTLQERFGVRGAVISAVDLILGLGRYAGMDLVHVPGATGLSDTNYEGKADACLEALRDHDLVYVHVEATDEAAHARDLPLKIRCIEMLDERLIARVLSGLEQRCLEATLAVLPDHPTPVETGKHGGDPVPVAIMGPGIEPDAVERFDEQACSRGALGLLKGDGFIRRVLGRA